MPKRVTYAVELNSGLMSRLLQVKFSSFISVLVLPYEIIHSDYHCSFSKIEVMFIPDRMLMTIH